MLSVAMLGVFAALPISLARADGLSTARESALSYLVRQDCGSCHGMTLRGGLGRALLPERLAGADIEGIAKIILDGIPGTPMPPWRGQLSEAEALWIARALKEGRIE